MNQEHIDTIKKAIDLLKIQDFSILLGKTSNGELSFKIPKDGEPHFTLDSVPVTKEIEKELQVLFRIFQM